MSRTALLFLCVVRGPGSHIRWFCVLIWHTGPVLGKYTRCHDDVTVLGRLRSRADSRRPDVDETSAHAYVGMQP